MGLGATIRRLGALAVIAIIAGCAPFSDDELRGLVEDVLPGDSSLVECEWGSQAGFGAEVPDAYYKCSYITEGGVDGVTSAIVTRLVAEGFLLSCARGASRVELVAARGQIAVFAEIDAPGVGPASEYDIPPGQVFLAVAAARFPQAPAVVADTGGC